MQRQFQGRPPAGPVRAPDEKEVRIAFSPMGQYMVITERDGKAIGVADLFACAQALSSSAYDALVKEQAMTLCQKCGRNLAAVAGDADFGGGDGDKNKT